MTRGPATRIAIAMTFLSVLQFTKGPEFSRYLSMASSESSAPEGTEPEVLVLCNVTDASLLPHQVQWFGSDLEDLLTIQCNKTLEEVKSMFHDPPAFGKWVKSLPSQSEEYRKILRSVERAEYSVELIQFLNRAHLSYSQMRFESFSYRSRPYAPRILIAVTAAPKLIERVGAIARTWGDEKNLPPNVLLRYYFGHDEHNVTALAEQAGIIDVSSIVLMPGIDDVEYPNTKKGAAVFRHMHMLAESLKEHSEGKVSVDWFFDVDDDSHVNVPNMIKYVGDKDPTRPQYIGHPIRGLPKDIGKLELPDVYCNGGPGFLITQTTLRALAEDYPSFLKEADAFNLPVFEDLRVGLFMFKQFRMGCAKTQSWEFMPRRKGINDDFDALKEASAIATHFYKKPGTMEAYHQWLQEFNANHKVDLKPHRYKEGGVRMPL